jgi:SpoVK/Ycf46/Vps4 family AAA+-type ATPase
MTNANTTLEADFVHLARVALSGRVQDLQVLLHRFAKRYRTGAPGLAEALVGLLREAPTRASPLRKAAEGAVPVDLDTRFQLLRVEPHPDLDQEPMYSDAVGEALSRLVAERGKRDQLLAAGLQPTRTALFTGPPGVGKTLSARWIARALGLPLVILDLGAVMSSYLGRTGANLRHVLDYAKSTDCVLLLDELDAIAKRRDDDGDIGELKRLVTVLIQQLDDWPESGLLLAATNHASLLDPAIWRRFEAVVEFPLPSEAAARQFIAARLAGTTAEPGPWAAILARACRGASFSDLERDLTAARRAAVLSGEAIERHLAQRIAVGRLSKPDRIALSAALVEGGFVSQREAQSLTGIARDTIRKHTQQKSKAVEGEGGAVDVSKPAKTLEKAK